MKQVLDDVPAVHSWKIDRVSRSNSLKASRCPGLEVFKVLESQGLQGL